MHPVCEAVCAGIHDMASYFSKLWQEIEMVNSGHCDGKLAEIWAQIQKKQKEKEDAKLMEAAAAAEPTESPAQVHLTCHDTSMLSVLSNPPLQYLQSLTNSHG